MKKRKQLLTVILAMLLIFALVPTVANADGENEVDSTGVNLIKVTTAEDFALGTSENMAVDTAGDGALKIAEGQTDGTFVSAVYSVKDFYKMVGSWNASLGEGAYIEVFARAHTDGDWSGWFSWGKYGMTIKRGSVSEDIDEFAPGGTIDKVQFMAVLHRDDAAAPAVVRQLSFSVKGGDAQPSYAEDVVQLPSEVTNPAPAYSQGVRDPSLSGSICSPSTMTVALNSRDPSIDLIPEELALSVQDFNYGFGNWAFCVSAAGLYGYESYAQYASKDILMQELAHGRSVGLSVSYSPEPNGSYPYLEGSYGGTGGHLISIIGYRYESGVIDDDHLYFYSSDTYSKNDATSFHLYKWTQLSECWSNRLAYIVMSEPEEGAIVTGVRRFGAELTAAEGDNTYVVSSGASKVDLTSFTNGKMSAPGHGVLAYTIDGMATDASEASDASVVYENRIQVTANDTFFYTGISTDDNGDLVFDGGDALYKAGVPAGEEKAVTIYIFANDGVTYRAEKTFASKKAQEEPMGDYEEVKTDANLTFADLTKGDVSGDAVKSSGRITLDGDSGIYISPVYSNAWEPEYLMATLNAVTPGASSAELQIRAVAEQTGGEWSGWFTWGQFGSGIESASNGSKTEYLNMGTDIFTARGDSSTANLQKYQFRILLGADAEGNVPTVFGLNFTVKKSAYDAAEATYTGKTSADDIPGSAAVAVEPTSAYSYAEGMASWRFENMMLMLLNGQGADPLFEEVALDGYDFSEGWGNWAFTPFKAGLFGYGAYTQFAANTTMIRQALADGYAVGLFVDGGAIPTTNSGGSRQIVVYAYETDADGDVTFRYYCCSGDTDELASGDVANSCSDSELQNAIESCTSESARGVMYVVTDKANEGSVRRVPVAAEYVHEQDPYDIRITLDGTDIAIPAGFEDDFDSSSGNGKTAYLLESTLAAGSKLSQAGWNYDIWINPDGTLKLPEDAVQALAGGDTIDLYIIQNNGITYTAKLVSPENLRRAKEEALKKVDEFSDALEDEVRTAVAGELTAIKQDIGRAKSLRAVEDALARLDDIDTAPSAKYKFVQGAGGSWTKDSGSDLVFRANGDFDMFIGVKVDGKDLDDSSYTASAGSTVIALKSSYLETLEAGEHELTAIYRDGSCNTSFFVQKAAAPSGTQGDKTVAGGNKGLSSGGSGKAPGTGDRSGLTGYLLVIAVCLAVTAVLAVRRRSGR